MRKLRVLSGALVLTLASSVLVQPLASAQDPTADSEMPAEVVEQLGEAIEKSAEGRTKQGTAQTGPEKVISGLDIAVINVDSVRAGGVGVVELDVTMRGEDNITARNVRLTADIANNMRVRVVRATSDLWKCRSDGQRVKCTTDAIHPDRQENRILLFLRGAPNLKNGSEKLRTWATWEEPRGARMSASTDTPSFNKKTNRYSVLTTSKIITNEALSIKVKRLGPAYQLTDGVGEDDIAMFSADVSGLNGTMGPLTWRQLCTTPAEAKRISECSGVSPPATMLQQKTDSEAEEDGSLSVQLPVVKKPTKLIFEAQVTEGGASARALASVTAMPFKPIEYESDVDSIEEFAALASDMNSGENLIGAKQVFTNGTIQGGDKPRAGKKVALTLAVPGKRVTSVDWTVTAGSASLLNGATRTGRTLEFVAPASLAGQSFVIEAKARLANGRVIEFSKLLDFAAKRGQETTRSYSYMASDVADLRQRGAETAVRVEERTRAFFERKNRTRPVVGTASGTLCSIAEIVKSGQAAPLPTDNDFANVPDVVLDGGAMVWLGNQAAVSDGLCSTATKINLSNAVMQYGEHTFVDVRGVISISGFSITGGAYQVPDEWTKEVPGLSGSNARLDFTVPKALPIDAKLNSKGEWGALGGEITFPTGLELLNLPNGWKFQPATFRFETTGLMALTLTARAPQTGAKNAEQLGSVSVKGAISPNGELDVEVTAANLVMFEDADGSEVTLDFGGGMVFSWEDNPEGDATSDLAFTVVPEISAAVNNVRFSQYVLAERIAVEWTPGRLGGEISLRIGTGDPANTINEVKSSFVYEGSEAWLVDANYQGAWDVGAGLKINGLKGEIEKDGKRLNISLGGDATGWKPSTAFELSTIQAELTNKCSPETKQPAKNDKANETGQECNQKSVRIDLTAEGLLNLGGKKVDWATSASFDIGSKKYTIRGSLTNADGIGPKEFNLTNVSIAVSNQNIPRICQPVGGVPANDTVFEITAAGKVLGAAVDFAGEYSESTGTCFIGSIRSGQQDKLDLPNPESFANLEFAWASQPATLDLQAGDQQTDGKRLLISANYKVAKDWERIGVSQGRFLGTFGYGSTGVTISAEIFVDFGEPGKPGPIIFGEASTNNLTIDAVGFEVSYAGVGGFHLTAMGLMTYRTVANSATDTIESATPFSVSITVGTQGLIVESKVDTERAPNKEARALTLAPTGHITGKDKEAYTTPAQIENAFGISGLVVRKLGLSAGLGPNTFIAFNADVTLPARWSEPIGMHPNAEISMGGALSSTNPCFKFGLKVSDPFAGADTFVINLGNGLLAAREMRLLVAPTGCVLPGNEVIEPGFGMTFDGQIGGKFEIRVAIDVVLPTTTNPRLFIDAKIKTSELSLGSVVTIKDTTLDFKVDTAAQLFELRVIGGINVLGQTANIDAYFKSQGLGTITLDAKADVNINLLGFASSNSKLDLGFEMVNFDVKVLRINAEMNVKVLGVTVAGVKAGLLYDQGKVVNLELAVTVGFNILIGSFTGTLGVEYFYDCDGVKLCATKKYTHLNLKVYLKGSIRILFWRKNFNIDIIDHRKPVSFTGDASQDAEWSVDETTGAKYDKDLLWTSARKLSVYGAEQGTWRSKVTAVSYDTGATVTTSNGEVDTKQTKARGNIVVSACVVKAGTKDCVRDSKYDAEVYFQAREIVMKNAVVTGEPVVNGVCQLASRCTTEDVKLTGLDWNRMVDLLNKARAEFAQANPGQSLPPIKMWSKDRPAVKTGSVYVINQDMYWASEDLDFARYGPPSDVKTSIPLAGDWDGNGFSELGYYTPAPSGKVAKWGQRQANGTTNTFERSPCGDFCRPIEPPGTLEADAVPAEFRSGGRGFAFPIVGDWDEVTTQHKALDDLGVVTSWNRGGNAGSLSWKLWPRNQEQRVFFLGEFKNGVVDRPVTGDWDGDGTTDVGVYRPPANPGETGTWLLVTSTSLNKQLKTTKFIEPDFRISYGSYGDLPVAGDWDNDGADGIGVVSRDRGVGMNIWSLRNSADFTCTTNCRVDKVVRDGYPASYPIVGRWKKSY